MVRGRKRLHKDIVKSPLLDILKIEQDVALSNKTQVTLLLSGEFRWEIRFYFLGFFSK